MAHNTILVAELKQSPRMASNGGGGMVGVVGADEEGKERKEGGEQVRADETQRSGCSHLGQRIQAAGAPPPPLPALPPPALPPPALRRPALRRSTLPRYSRPSTPATLELINTLNPGGKTNSWWKSRIRNHHPQEKYKPVPTDQAQVKAHSAPTVRAPCT